MDDVLHFPAALSERQGLALVKRLEENSSLAGEIRAVLHREKPETGGAEQAILAKVLADKPGSAAGRASPKPLKEITAPQGVRMRVGPKRIELSGAAVDEALVSDLQGWLAVRLRD